MVEKYGRRRGTCRWGKRRSRYWYTGAPWLAVRKAGTSLDTCEQELNRAWSQAGGADVRALRFAIRTVRNILS